MEQKRKTLGIALGAGGSRGVAHIGFLRALDEEGIKPDYLCGCSFGAVVGLAYASGISPSEMYSIVRKLSSFDLLRPTLSRGGLSGTEKIKALLEKHVGKRNFSDLKIPFACEAVDMRSERVVAFTSGNAVEAVVASSCIPAIFKPVETDEMRLIDGGVLDRVPSKLVKDMGAEVVVAVDVLGGKRCGTKKVNALGALLETIDLTDNYRTAKLKEERKDIIDFWLEPKLGNRSQYSLKYRDEAYDAGVRLGKAYAKKIGDALNGK